MLEGCFFSGSWRRKTKGSMAHTMREVARRAGVSLATVSRVLHNKGKHTEETRKAVMNAVREYDFQLNDTAASLAMMRNSSSQS